MIWKYWILQDICLKLLERFGRVNEVVLIIGTFIMPYGHEPHTGAALELYYSALGDVLLVNAAA